MRNPIGRQGGFTLVELLVAMAITLIVSGAIFGLLQGGQSAFRREPELTDRQQNIRLAMSLIERDLHRAGAKMALYTQVFANALDGQGPLGLAGNSDLLEVRGNDDECPDLPVVGVAGTVVSVMTRVSDCYPIATRTPVLLSFPGGATKWGLAQVAHTSPDTLTFGSPQPAGSQILGSGDLIPAPSRVGLFNVVRYQIATAPGDTVTSLYRSPTGGVRMGDGTLVDAPDTTGGWQLVARGIEDLQVRYEVRVRYPLAGPPTSTWQDTPGAVVVNDPDTVVRRVEVMLSARALANALQGQTANANLGAAVRGQLVTRVAPRASLLALQDPVKINSGQGWY